MGILKCGTVRTNERTTTVDFLKKTIVMLVEYYLMFFAMFYFPLLFHLIRFYRSYWYYYGVTENMYTRIMRLQLCECFSYTNRIGIQPGLCCCVRQFMTALLMCDH